MNLQTDGVSALERLHRGDLDAVIFETDDAYVQFAGDPTDTRCEAVGDLNLAVPLTFQQLQELAKLRFYPPDADSAGNHWQHLKDAPPKLLLCLAVTVFRRVYGSGPSEITVKEV